MKKEKTIRTYQRRTKTGKVVTVKQHTAKYDAAEAMKEAAKKKGAGDELENLKKKAKPEKVKVEKPAEDAPDYGFTADEYKAWYHWDQAADPKNKTALKVEKALKKQMGTKAYNKYFDDLTDNYSARGHNKAFKGLSEKLSTGEKKAVTSGKETKGSKKEAKASKEASFKKGDIIKKSGEDLRKEGFKSSTSKESTGDFKVSDSTMRKIDQRIKKLENFKVKMWGHPERAKQAAAERKREIRDLKKAKEYLASGDRQKAARLLTNDSDYGTFKRSEFYSKAEIKSQKEKSAKQKAKKEQDAYNKKLESARSILAEHEKKQAAEKRKAGKSKTLQTPTKKEKGLSGLSKRSVERRASAEAKLREWKKKNGIDERYIPETDTNPKRREQYYRKVVGLSKAEAAARSAKVTKQQAAARDARLERVRRLTR